MRKEVDNSLKNIHEKNKTFVERVELNWQQTELNFPEKVEAINHLKTGML